MTAVVRQRASDPEEHRSSSPRPRAADPAQRRWRERPFAPAFSARPKGTKAGAYSPVSLQITRGDGQQELKGADITLAPGMTGKLAGISYCPASALSRRGRQRRWRRAGQIQCPASSLVGSATIVAGTGSAPLQIGGKVFLSAPIAGLLSPWQSSPPPRPGPSTWARSWSGWRCSSSRDGADSRRLRPDPQRLRGRPTQRPQGRRRDRPQEIHPQPDQLRPAELGRQPQRRRFGPGQPGGVQRLPGQHSVPDQRLRGAPLQAEAVHAVLRGEEGDQARPPRNSATSS